MSILVEYKGGGYEGCFWEWNFFHVDNHGKYSVIRATGRQGAKTQAEMLHVLKNPAKYDAYIYDLKKQADIDNFTENSNCGNVLTCLKWLRIHDDTPYKAKCSRCGQYHDIDEFTIDYDNYKGDGGIGISYQGGIICETCKDNFSCPECGAYMTERETETAGKFGECDICKPEMPADEDLTDEDRQQYNELQSELNWLNKHWLDIPDREAKLEKVQTAIVELETELAYAYDPRYQD